ncbi:MAG: carboxypeptidase-like regulatory domain-containing protein [Mucilaginibacter sp.]
MIKIKRLNIPQPCGQDWSQMTATESGRHCESCAKTVVDFTRMSNDEVICYLSTNRHVCARIGAQQMTSINMQLVSRQSQNKGGWAKWVMVASLFVATAYNRANAQNATHATEQTVNDNAQAQSSPLGKVYFPDSANYQVITGRVTDNNNVPLPGAAIKVSGANTGTQTDVEGNFRLQIPTSTKSIKVSFLGFESTIIEIRKADKVLKVRLKENSAMLGGMGVTRQTLLKRLYARFIQNSVRGMFSRDV